MLGRSSRSLLILAPVLIVATACSRNEAAPASPAAAPPAPTVAVLQVTPETVQISSEWITTLDGYANGQIRPQVSGYLVKRNYREGALVRKGDVLFEVDDRTFLVALAQAEAQLAEAQAQLGRAEKDVERDTPLAKERAIAQSQLDNEIQVQLAAQATVKATQAAVDAARLNINFTKVRSLLDGVAGIATAQIGDLVGPATLLATVSQVDPIRAYFSLSEQEYLRIAKQINASSRSKDLWQTGGGLKLTLADGTVYPAPGQFLAADRQIDPTTGTIRISATFPNPQQLLRPGQYGRVTADTQTVEGALLVPQRAVTDLQGGSQLRIVGPDDVVHVKTVKTGAILGTRILVVGGLAAGDRVIVDSGAPAEGSKVSTKPYAPDANGRGGH
jgi:membrane fusion protein (multidrug efflux system)